MSIKIAVVQPVTHMPPEDEKNVADCVGHIEHAASQGADFVCFPESYPGPWQMPAPFDPTDAISAAAKANDIHVVFSTLEPIDEATGKAYNLTAMAYPDGRAVARYRRTHPPGPWLYEGGRHWKFNYVAGDDYPVFDTKHGKVGLAMCSEVYMPEVTRALALRGAELIFMPAGLDKCELWETWRNLIWARATENLAMVVTTQNIRDDKDRGLAMVAAPEEVIMESRFAGTYFVDVSLDRVRELRSQMDEAGSSHSNGAKAGILTQWQRPEMYDRFYPTPNKEAAE